MRPWNVFVKWRGERLSERKTFTHVKSHSAGITFYQNANIFNHLPTRFPPMCKVRQAATRKFGLSPSNRKAPFKWSEVAMFATAYDVLQQGYFHLVVSSMSVSMFGEMCRYSDVSCLRWRNLRFDDDGNLDVIFDHGCRINSQFRQGGTVTVSANPWTEMCPVRLLRELEKLV